jgi:ABC-2 type transport system permease protein
MVVAIFMALNHVQLTTSALLIIPLVFELFVVSLSAAFILSALFVRLRDVTYIWDIVVQAGFYVTPVLYLLSRLPHKFAKIAILSPLAQIIQDARHALVTTRTTTIYQVYGGDKWVWLIPTGLTLMLLIIGATYFRSQSKSFAEEV